MDLFYRGYDPNARITSAAQHLSAAASRFALSILYGIPHLPETTWVEFKRLLSVNALWALCLILAGWLIATIVGGLVGLAVNAVLIVYGLSELWEQLKSTAGALEKWVRAAYEANSEADLDVAGAHFAAALSMGGMTILEVVLTHRVFRAVEGRLGRTFPAPDWLQKKYEEASTQRELNRAAVERSKVTEAVKATVDLVTSGSRYAGAKRAADEFPTAAMVIGGAAVAIGTVAIVAWVSSASAQQDRGAR